MSQTIAVKLKPNAERHIKKGHPWVFDEAIIKENKEPSTGDVAIIFDGKKNNFLAIGLYDLESPIRIKILQAHESAKLGFDWIKSNIERALEVRQPLFDKAITGYRLINGENDKMPSLIVDVYAGVVVIKLYALIWQPFFEDIKKAIVEILSPKAIVLRAGRNIQDKLEKEYQLSDGDIIHGELSNPEVAFDEYGVRFIANVIDGHKTGYFLDHRENRHRIGQMSKGKTVLDIFSYAGGFSVHALFGGAKKVTSVDISKHALAVAKKNSALNGLDANHITVCGDAFEVMENYITQGVKFDIVVVDPPSFAKNKQEVKRAIQSYERLASLAPKLIEKGGKLMMASCSSRISRDEFFEIIETTFEEDNLQYRIIDKTFHAIDHPTTFEEGKYLKTGYYQF